jgi:hypothetical protein
MRWIGRPARSPLPPQIASLRPIWDLPVIWVKISDGFPIAHGDHHKVANSLNRLIHGYPDRTSRKPAGESWSAGPGQTSGEAGSSGWGWSMF